MKVAKTFNIDVQVVEAFEVVARQQHAVRSMIIEDLMKDYIAKNDGKKTKHGGKNREEDE